MPIEMGGVVSAPAAQAGELAGAKGEVGIHTWASKVQEEIIWAPLIESSFVWRSPGAVQVVVGGHLIDC